jgi:hypothetical protein
MRQPVAAILLLAEVRNRRADGSRTGLLLGPAKLSISL